MGRAQVVQAQAAGIEPHTDMNPVLLKPEADSRSQVIVNGKPIGSFEARKYWGDQTEIWKAVTDAYDRLAAKYDVIVLEGAGSPAEVNLRDRDIVNMKMAAYAKASVILVGDIDRGGVFGSLLPEERALVKATLINRFRGDIALLDPFRRANCRIRIVTNPHELTTAQIIIIPGSKSTIADLRWMKSRGLDKAVIEAANRGVAVVGICGGYQILGQQLDDP